MKRRGYTLIEMAVVLALIAILIALLLAGILSSREQSRRAACLNNLRQLGVAVQAHVGDRGVLPQGINRGSYSFFAMLLPYLDQRPTYNGINFSVGSFPRMDPSGLNYTFMQISLNVLLCPVDGGAGGALPRTNYAGNRGRGVQQFGYDGAFSFEPDGPIGLSAFRDGTSTTVAVGEWVLGTGLAMRLMPDPRRSTFDTPRPFPKPGELERFADECRALDPAKATVNLLGKGDAWISGEFSYSLI